jgi:hypothetical protein
VTKSKLSSLIKIVILSEAKDLLFAGRNAIPGRGP